MGCSGGTVTMLIPMSEPPGPQGEAGIVKVERMTRTSEAKECTGAWRVTVLAVGPWPIVPERMLFWFAKMIPAREPAETPPLVVPVVSVREKGLRRPKGLEAWTLSP